MNHRLAWTAPAIVFLLACARSEPVTVRFTIELDESAGTVGRVSDAMDRVMPIIRARLEESGVRNPMLERVGRNRIVATLPRVRDVDRLGTIIATQGVLEFRITDMQGAFEGMLDHIDSALAGAGVTVGEHLTCRVGEVATEREAILSSFLCPGQMPGEVFVAEDDVPKVTRLMKHPEFQRNVPPGIDLLWGREPMSLSGRLYRGLYAVSSRPIITGEQLADALPQVDRITKQTVVAFQLTRAGGKIFARATSEHVGDFMAIVFDGRVQGRPPVIGNQIGRRGLIELGNTSVSDAQDLALVLRAGALPVPIQIVEVRVDSSR